MSSLSIAFISFACIFGGAMLGMALRRFLPAHHLRDDSKDTIKLGAGLIATLAALVLGLLVGSAKGSFDAASAAVTQSAAKIMVLDSVLARYGDDAKPARDELRRMVAAGIETIWPEHKTGVSGLRAYERANGAEMLQNKLLELKPETQLQGPLRSRALDLNNDLLQTRWLVIEQQQGGLPVPLLVVLVLWLAILYASFGLFAPRNATVITVLCVCALSASAAIFLISEMNSPLAGMIKVSSAPMLKALELLSR